MSSQKLFDHFRKNEQDQAKEILKSMSQEQKDEALFELFESYYDYSVKDEQKDEKQIIEIAKVLLENEADPNYQKEFHCGCNTTFGNMIDFLSWFKDKGNKVKLMQLFFDREVEYVNDINSQSESGTSWNYYYTQQAVLILMDQQGFTCPVCDENTKQLLWKQKLQNNRVDIQALEEQKDDEDANIDSIQEQISKLKLDINQDDEDAPVVPEGDLTLIKHLVGYHLFDANSLRETEQFDEDHMMFDLKKENETPFHRAIKCGVTELVKIIVNKGADISVPCRYTEWKLSSPEFWSEEQKQSKIEEKKEINKNAKKDLELAKQEHKIAKEKLEAKEVALKTSLGKNELSYEDQDHEYKELEDASDKIGSKISQLNWKIEQTENYDPLKSEYPKIETKVYVLSCLALAEKFVPDNQEIRDILTNAGATMEHDPQYFG